MNIVIIGVGGQGTLLASRVLGKIGLNNYDDVTVSEIHGMSQRGGSVVTFVRMGSAIASPIIENGMADILLAFEELEALRGLPYLKKGGKILLNSQRIMPMPVVCGACTYPDDLLARLDEKQISYTAVDALSLAREAGNVKCVNTVMLGVLAKQTEIPLQQWLDVLAQCVPQKTVEINNKAFMLGYNYII